MHGLSDLDNIAKEKRFLNSLTPKIDIIMIQQHKLRGMLLEKLGARFLPFCPSWILEATLRERSWLNPNEVGKGGVGIY